MTASDPRPKTVEAVEQWNWDYFRAQVLARGKMSLYPVRQWDFATIAQVAARYDLLARRQGDEVMVLSIPTVTARFRYSNAFVTEDE